MDMILGQNTHQAIHTHYSYYERLYICTTILTFLWDIGGSVKLNILKHNRYFSVHLSVHNRN